MVHSAQKRFGYDLISADKTSSGRWPLGGAIKTQADILAISSSGSRSTYPRPHTVSM